MATIVCDQKKQDKTHLAAFHVRSFMMKVSIVQITLVLKFKLFQSEVVLEKNKILVLDSTVSC